MHTEKVDAQDLVGASALLGAGLSEQLSVTGRYDVKCFDADGNLKWEDSIKNLVVNVGKANLLNVYFGAATQTTLWYMGLVDSAGFVNYNSGDTMTTHVTGWTESAAYSSATRPQITFGTGVASGGGVNSPGTGTITNPSAVSFIMNATATIQGAFLTTNNTKSGTTGTLYSAGSFAASRAVIAGDSLLVTYTAQS
jgi:hypothetical protein